MRHQGICAFTGRLARGGWLLGGVLLMSAGGCEDAKPDTGKPVWDEGIYHVEVELDTADRLATSSTSDDDSRVGLVGEFLGNNLYLSVDQFDEPFSCTNLNDSRTAMVVESMQMWLGDWYADLLLPTNETCFNVSLTVPLEELDLDPDFVERWRYEALFCTTDMADSMLSENGEPVSINLKVTCEWRREGDCEGCD